MTAQALGPSESLPDAPTTAIEAIATPSGDVDCGHCGLLVHHHGCLPAPPPSTASASGLPTAVWWSRRGSGSTWSIPMKVPTAFDMFGNPAEFADARSRGRWPMGSPSAGRDHP